jgi:tRNA (cmo5U34)-methyltransferase
MDSSIQMVCVTVEKLTTLGIHHLNPVFFDLEKEEYTDKTFDVIFSQMALHHVTDIEKIISTFSKLLNPGGKLAIADLYKEDSTFHDRNFTGHMGFDPGYLSGLLIKKGFLNVKYEQCFVIEKTSEDGVTKNFPIFLMTAEKQKS